MQDFLTVLEQATSGYPFLGDSPQLAGRVSGLQPSLGEELPMLPASVRLLCQQTLAVLQCKLFTAVACIGSET